MKRRAFLVTGLLLALLGQAAAQLSNPKPGWNLFSKEQDIQLGREFAAQIKQEKPMVRNAAIESYIRQIGQKLAAQPQAGGYPYTFDVVNDPAINAFALPGGPTFTHTGLILAAENEAQLAGVLAHEISHVALRHGTNQASKANLIQLPAMLAAGILGNGSITGQLAQLGIGLGANSVLLKFSRNAERDADLLGAQMMAAAGYNPIEAARFFEKLEAESGKGNALTEFLSSHPNPGNRRAAIEREIQYLPRKEYTANSGRLAEIQRAVKGLGPAPKQTGQVQSGASSAEMPTIRPSSRFREYQSREFRVAYPDNWQTFGDQGSAMVTIAPREGMVQSQNGQGAIGYGAIMSFFHPGDGRRQSLAKETDALIRQLQAGNPGMQRARNGSRRTRIGGQNALVTTLVNQSPFQGQREMDYLVTVSRPEALFYMVFIVPESEASRGQQTFQKMMESVRFN